MKFLFGWYRWWLVFLLNPIRASNRFISGNMGKEEKILWLIAIIVIVAGIMLTIR